MGCKALRGGVSELHATLVHSGDTNLTLPSPQRTTVGRKAKRRKTRPRDDEEEEEEEVAQPPHSVVVASSAPTSATPAATEQVCADSLALHDVATNTTTTKTNTNTNNACIIAQTSCARM